MSETANPCNPTTDVPMWSIVIPLFNAQEYIADTIAAIENQTDQDWELIIVDDASSDDSAVIAESLAELDARITVIRHDSNEWVSATRNTGLARATGRYVWFCDCDDSFEPTLLAKCRQALESNPADAVVFGHIESYSDGSGRHLYDHAIIPKAGVYPTPEEFHPQMLDLEVCTSYGYPWNKVFRLEHIREEGLGFERGDFVEDITFNIKFFQNATSLDVIDKPLYRYEKRLGANITNSFDPRYYVKHRARIQMLRDQLESWGLLDEHAEEVLGSLYGRYIISAMERNCDKRSGMGQRDRKIWLAEVFGDPLFNELIPHAKAEDSKILEMCLAPLKSKKLDSALRLGTLVHLVRGNSNMAYTKIKSGR